MANPNPSPSTRFSADNPGTRRAKQKGARDRLSAAFLTAFADDFDKHGAKTIAKVRVDDPGTYLRVAATIIPKEIEATDPLRSLTDEKLAEVIELLTANIRAKAHDEAPLPVDAKRTLQ